MTLLDLMLPAVGFCLIWWLVTLRRELVGMAQLSRRGTFVVSFVLFEAVLVLMTEALSVGSHLTSGAVAISWLLVDVALAAALVLSTGLETLRAQVRVVSPRSVASVLHDSPGVILLGLAAIGVYLVGLVVVGWLYLPNNTDSLVYHLPRVPEWIQQSSAHHFATHYTAQIEFAPLHEFNMLHVQLLGGGDRLIGYVQLGALTVCVVGASEIARLLGARAEAQMAAAVICAVIPSAVLQATSTQNDILAAAIGVALFVILLGWPVGGRWLGPAVLLGIAVGLAILSKGTLPLVIGPALVLVAIRLLWLERRRSSTGAVLRRAGGVLIAGLACAALIAGPFLKRNHDLFGTITGPVSDSTINGVVSAPGAIGNVIRSVAVNFRVGDGRSGVDTLVQRAVLGGSRELYDVVGASQDDSRFVIGALDDAFATGDYSYFSRTEEFGANPWHVLLLVVSGGVLAVKALRRDRSAYLPALLAVGLSIGFVAFSATARWSLFVGRYQLPLLVIWAPLIALALSQVHRFVLRGVVVFLVVAAMPQLLDNTSRSLLHPRTDFPSDVHQYFVHPGGDGFFVAPEDYVAARDAIVASGCDRLGIANWILLEYPIWVGLDNAGWRGQIEHVDVDNASRVLEHTDFEPCALIRQSVGRPAESAPAGWVDVPFGGLTVSFAPAG